MRQAMMDKEVLILPNIVLTDIITNSSSEIFICNTDKTKEAVEEFLFDLYELLGKGCSPLDQMTVGKLDYNTFSNIAWYKYDYDFYDECRSSDGKVDYKKVHRMQDDFIASKWNTYDKKDSLIIESTSDNSIPYDVWDILINNFNAERIHLG